MKKRIYTNYNKLNSEVKKAIRMQYPHGVDDELIKMKNIHSGKMCDGLLFDFDDITYMIEWNVSGHYEIDYSDQFGELEAFPEEDEL